MLHRLRPHGQEHPGDIHFVHTRLVVLRVRLSPVPQSSHIHRTVGAVSASVSHHTSVVPMVVLQNDFHRAKRRATKFQITRRSI